MKELYVVNCCRTAIGSFGGSLKNTPAVDMGAIVVKEALKRANVAPENVDELMFGCILTAGQGQNPARQVSVKAGIPYSVPAYTVGMVCGSGMKSVIEGARSILAGDSDIVVCGGTGYSIDLKRYGTRDWGWYMAFGILAILCSLLILWQPAIGALYAVYMISFTFLIIGLFRVMLSFELKNLHKRK